MADLDRISTRTKAIIPVTWDALWNDTKRGGESVLVSAIEYVEALIFGDIPDEEAQKEMKQIVIEFAAKSAVLEIIDPAIDFWMEKKTAVTTTGTNEQVTYPDRIAALKELKKNLLEQLAKLEPIVAPLIPVITERRSKGKPLLSTLEDDLLTPNPQDFGPAYAPKVEA